MKKQIKITESPSQYKHLEKMPVRKLLQNISREDHKVPSAVKKVVPQIEKAVKIIFQKMLQGGRLFYIGSGTSGRLGIVDASECPPTYGVPHGLVIGVIAGGDGAIRKAVEFAEDDTKRGWKDLKKHNISKKDVLVGISASGTTPYVIGAVRDAKRNGVFTIGLSANKNSYLSKFADLPIEVIVGSEFVTGSTRMKAGTAQKLVLNMISTSAMIKLGRVLDNKMIDMQLTNNKLICRGTQMISEMLDINKIMAKKLLLRHGSVRKVLENYK